MFNFTTARGTQAEKLRQASPPPGGHMKKSIAVLVALGWLLAGCTTATSTTTSSSTTTTTSRPTTTHATRDPEASGNLHDEVNQLHLAAQAAALQLQEDTNLIKQLFAVNPFSNGLEAAYKTMADLDYPALDCTAAYLKAELHFPDGYQG